jgi:hypothetical protein
MLSDAQLEGFMGRFFGYGNRGARFWLVGMEEGGGHDEREVRQRLDAWHALDCQPVVDCVDFSSRVEDETGDSLADTWFGGQSRIQPTWGPLIRLYLRLSGNSAVTSDDVRRTHHPSYTNQSDYFEGVGEQVLGLM